MITYKAIWIAIFAFYFFDVILIFWLSVKLNDEDINNFSLATIAAPLWLLMLVVLPIVLLGILLLINIEKLAKRVKRTADKFKIEVKN